MGSTCRYHTKQHTTPLIFVFIHIPQPCVIGKARNEPLAARDKKRCSLRGPSERSYTIMTCFHSISWKATCQIELRSRFFRCLYPLFKQATADRPLFVASHVCAYGAWRDCYDYHAPQSPVEKALLVEVSISPHDRSAEMLLFCTTLKILQYFHILALRSGAQVLPQSRPNPACRQRLTPSGDADHDKRVWVNRSCCLDPVRMGAGSCT
jgi:hypothetical protein